MRSISLNSRSKVDPQLFIDFFIMEYFLIAKSKVDPQLSSRIFNHGIFALELNS